MPIKVFKPTPWVPRPESPVYIYNYFPVKFALGDTHSQLQAGQLTSLTQELANQKSTTSALNSQLSDISETTEQNNVDFENLQEKYDQLGAAIQTNSQKIDDNKNLAEDSEQKMLQVQQDLNSFNTNMRLSSEALEGRLGTLETYVRNDTEEEAEQNRKIGILEKQLSTRAGDTEKGKQCTYTCKQRNGYKSGEQKSFLR